MLSSLLISSWGSCCKDTHGLVCPFPNMCLETDHVQDSKRVLCLRRDLIKCLHKCGITHSTFTLVHNICRTPLYSMYIHITEGIWYYSHSTWSGPAWQACNGRPQYLCCRDDSTGCDSIFLSTVCRFCKLGSPSWITKLGSPGSP